MSDIEELIRRLIPETYEIDDPATPEAYVVNEIYKRMYGKNADGYTE